MKTFMKWIATFAMPPVIGWLCLAIFKLLILFLSSAPEDSDAYTHPLKMLLLVAVGDAAAGYLCMASAYELAPRAKMAASILVTAAWACTLCWLARDGGYWIDIACGIAGAIAFVAVQKKSPSSRTGR